MQEFEVFRISNGKLADMWDLWDGWEYYGQLGLYDVDHWPGLRLRTVAKTLIREHFPRSVRKSRC